MDEGEKHVITDRVLEHSIFSNRNIYIMTEDEPDKKVSFYVEEIMKDSFVAEISPENLIQIKQENLKSKNLQVMIGHKNQAFVFPSQLVDFVEEKSGKPKEKKTRYFFHKPHTGILRNQRLNPRFDLKESSFFLKAEIRVSSRLGEFTFETRHLVDLSHTSISLFLDRSQGLVLPGDKVKSITLYRQNEIVLEALGVIFRTDVKRVSEQMEKSYFVVIKIESNVISDRWQYSERSGSLGAIPMDQQKAFVEGEHPILQGYKFSGEIRDLSTSRISFTVERLEMPFVMGLVLNNIHVNIPPNDFNLKACIKIIHCSLEDESEGKRLVVLGHFLGMSIDLIKAVNRLKDHRLDLRLVEAKREDFEQLMEFFFESGFIYSAKRKQLQKYAASVKRTNMILLEADAPIVKKVVFKDDHVIKGHISALRFFDRSWLIHHLTTHNSPGTAIARAILFSISNFFLDSTANQKVNTQFVTCYFQPTNLFPEMIFGEFKRKVANPEICDMSDLDVCVLSMEKSESKRKKDKSKVQCYEAQEDDLLNLERLLISQGQYFLIRVEGLTHETMTRLEVSAEYEKLGLYRKRRVFVAQYPGMEEVVYAVCNYASPGCNFSELTNSFRFYYADTKSPQLPELLKVLSEHVLATYQATEMDAPILLMGVDQVMPVQFKKIRRYRYWFLDAAFIELFMTITESHLANPKQVLKKLVALKHHPENPISSSPSLKEMKYEQA